MVVGCSLFYPLGANLIGYPSSTVPITIKDGVRVRRVKVKPPVRAEFKFGEPIPFGFKVISCNPADNKVFVEEVEP